MCRVHLVPIRGGLLALPRLDVTATRGNQDMGNVSFMCKALCGTVSTCVGGRRELLEVSSRHDSLF